MITSSLYHLYVVFGFPLHLHVKFTEEPFDNIFDGASIVAESISMNQNGNAAIFNFIIFI